MSEPVTRDEFERVLEYVEELEETVERQTEQIGKLTQRVEKVEEENERLREQVEEEAEQNQRTRASLSKLINEVRDLPEGERISAASPNIVAEAANTASDLVETMERAEENSGLLNFQQKRPERESVNKKYLQVLGKAEQKAEETGQETVFLNYREVATAYGCAYKNDGYRVMEEMEDRVPGVFYKDGHRASEIDATTTVDEKCLRVEWNHPDLRGWVRAHRDGDAPVAETARGP